MLPVVVDSGPLYALFDGGDAYHEKAVDFLKQNHRPLLTNIAVITEVVYLLDYSVEAQQNFLTWAQQALQIDDQTATDLPAINTLLQKYSDLPADFADASLVALCNRLKLQDVVSVDSDFTIYRTAAKKPFNNLLA